VTDWNIDLKESDSNARGAPTLKKIPQKAGWKLRPGKFDDEISKRQGINELYKTSCTRP